MDRKNRVSREPEASQSAGGASHGPEASQMQEAKASEPEAKQVQEAKASDAGSKADAGAASRGACVQLDLFEEKLLDPGPRSRHKLIGQLFATYWLVEFKDQLYIIDQHAAHENVLYEKTMIPLKTREYTCQQIHPPIT